MIRTPKRAYRIIVPPIRKNASIRIPENVMNETALETEVWIEVRGIGADAIDNKACIEVEGIGEEPAEAEVAGTTDAKRLGSRSQKDKHPVNTRSSSMNDDHQ